MKKIMTLVAMTLLLGSCTPSAQQSKLIDSKSNIEKITKSETEWKSELSEQAFYVLREKGTERAFTGEYWDNKKEGIYQCRACKLPLFSSETKFKSGTGWPSFYDMINSKNIHHETDYKLGYGRTELTCNRCEGHLGHVFDDGPKPTGQRYCINSISLYFIPKTTTSSNP